MDWRRVSYIKGFYFLATGIWPILDIRGFMAVTGPKTDLWLVRTVGVLLVVIGVTLLRAVWRGRPSDEIAMLGIGSFLAGIAGPLQEHGGSGEPQRGGAPLKSGRNPAARTRAAATFGVLLRG